MIKPITSPCPIPFQRISPIKTAFKDGVLPLKKGFFGGDLTPKNVSLDHMLAKSKGGKSKLSNYVLTTSENNNLKGDMDIFRFATKENTEQYFKAFEGVKLGKHTGEQYLAMISRTLRELWTKSPITKDLEMWDILKRY